MPPSSHPKHNEYPDADDFARRYETLGDRDEVVQPSAGARHRRTIEDCVRETEEQRRLGLEVTCHPTWEGIRQAHEEAGVQMTKG